MADKKRELFAFSGLFFHIFIERDFHVCVVVVLDSAILPLLFYAFFFSSKSKKSPAIEVAFGLASDIPPSPVTAVAEGYLGGERGTADKK